MKGVGEGNECIGTSSLSLLRSEPKYCMSSGLISGSVGSEGDWGMSYLKHKIENRKAVLMDKLGGAVRRLRHLAWHLVAGGGEGGGRRVEPHAAEGDVGGRRGEDGIAFTGQDRVQIGIGERPGVGEI